jgi:type I restriction enzyme S subunit
MSGANDGERVASLRHFNAYPAYKDSGVEWLGEIPAGWEVKRVKDAASKIGSGRTPSGGAEVYVSDGVMLLRSQNVHFGRLRLDDVAFIDSATDRQMAGSRVKEADVLLNITGASLGRCCVARLDGRAANVNQHVCVIRALPGAFDPTFLAAALASHAGQAQIFTTENGISRDALNFEQIGRLRLTCPPLAQQRAIAAFLNRETARIDVLVAKKKRLIELLQEQRTALITRAVTKGLDLNVPMKDSGVEWLGEIPAHWTVKRLWHLTPSGRRIMYGIVLPGPNVDDGVPIVKGGDVAPERLRLDRLNRTAREIESGYVRSRLQGGDLVYAIRGSIGEVAMVPDELTGANLTQDAARIAYTSATHGPWLLHALKSSVVFAQVDAGALGATIRGINIRDLKRASLAAPPRAEQRVIAASLNRETARIDALVTKVHSAIARLKELRTALISAAVTGKIDVREEVA